jgi:hypothetical protein
VSAQPKAISEVVKEFEQSLENLRPSTRRIYVANPARLGADRCAMRGAFKRNSSKMARKLPQNRGARSASVGHGNRGTMLRSSLALLACLERAPGPTGPAAALPKISPLEPIKAPFPRAQRRPLEPGSTTQRSAATQLDRRAQQFPAHHSGEDQSRFPL